MHTRSRPRLARAGALALLCSIFAIGALAPAASADDLGPTDRSGQPSADRQWIFGCRNGTPYFFWMTDTNGGAGVGGSSGECSGTWEINLWFRVGSDQPEPTIEVQGDRTAALRRLAELGISTEDTARWWEFTIDCSDGGTGTLYFNHNVAVGSVNCGDLKWNLMNW